MTDARLEEIREECISPNKGDFYLEDFVLVDVARELIAEVDRLRALGKDGRCAACKSGRHDQCGRQVVASRATCLCAPCWGQS